MIEGIIHYFSRYTEQKAVIKLLLLRKEIRPAELISSYRKSLPMPYSCQNGTALICDNYDARSGLHALPPVAHGHAGAEAERLAERSAGFEAYRNQNTHQS
jgi:hypothetical protein